MLVFSYVPNMTFIATSTFINGFGANETDIAKIYDNNYEKGSVSELYSNEAAHEKTDYLSAFARSHGMHDP